MEHECFENAAIAAQMNDALREHQGRSRGAARPRSHLHERRASADRTGRLADVGLPDAGRTPFFGGTYFPPDDRYGLPGFPSGADAPSPTAWQTSARRSGSRPAKIARSRQRYRRSAGTSELTTACSTRLRIARAGVRSHRTAALAARRNSRSRWRSILLLRWCTRDRRRKAATPRCSRSTRMATAAFTISSAAASTATARRALAGAALREDAVRQRAARARLSPCVQLSGRDDMLEVCTRTLDYMARELRVAGWGVRGIAGRGQPGWRRRVLRVDANPAA